MSNESFRQMSPLVLDALTVLRNDYATEDFTTFATKLDAISQKCITLGLSQDLELVQGVLFRGQYLMKTGTSASVTLQGFTDLLPNARNIPQATLAADRKRTKALNKLASKTATPGQSATAFAASQAASMAAASTAPLRGPLTLPLLTGMAAGGASSQGGARKHGSSYKGGKGGGGGGGGHAAASAPRPPPSAKAAQERLDYNKDIQAKQQAITYDPQGNFCKDCDRNNRTPHHYFRACAFSMCHNCQRGGHRRTKCPFPAYP